MGSTGKALRAVVAGVLCGVLAGQPVYAAGLPKGRTRATGEMRGDARVLHALNRFTFGPRPGDVAAVEAMGLDKWFDQQLNPGRIDDSRLDARLADYPAMRLSIGELEARYPGPQAIRQMENGKVDLPSDPTARTIAVDEIAFYKSEKAKQAEVKQAAGDLAMASVGGSTAAAAVAPPPAKGGKKKQVRAGFDALDQVGPGMGADKPLAANEMASDEMVGSAPVERRAGPEEIAGILAQEPEQRYKTVLAMPGEELVSFRQSLKPRQLAALVDGMSPTQKETLVALPGAIRMISAEVMESRLLRDVYSERQLEAVMTDFWLNHFNLYLRKNQQEPYLIPSYERETIRANALGNFEDLLVATAKSPAMLVYLDNFRSIGPDSQAAERVKRIKDLGANGSGVKAASAGLNENYGRELMELQTLGVNGGYTQADVTAVAKVFTGWTVDKVGLAQDGGGVFEFNERRHEPGSKTVLGKTIKEGGEKEGLEVLHMLATSPATAHFICEKLAVRFVSDTPPPALVDRMAASFTDSKGDIKTVLRTMWRSPEFWSTRMERAKVKTPEEFVVSAVRASGAEVLNPLSLVQSLDKLGMPLYGMQTPNGYSWKEDGWVSTGALVSRMNFALMLADGRLPGIRTDWGPVLAGQSVALKGVTDDPAKAEEGKERRLETVLLGWPVSERTRTTVLEQAKDTTMAEQAAMQFDLKGGAGKGGKYRKGKGMGGGAEGGTDDAQAAVMAGLLLGSPEFQRR